MDPHPSWTPFQGTQQKGLIFPHMQFRNGEGRSEFLNNEKASQTKSWTKVGCGSLREELHRISLPQSPCPLGNVLTLSHQPFLSGVSTWDWCPQLLWGTFPTSITKWSLLLCLLLLSLPSLLPCFYLVHTTVRPGHAQKDSREATGGLGWRENSLQFFTYSWPWAREQFLSLIKK